MSYSSLSGLLHPGPQRLPCDGVERQTGLKVGASRSFQQGTGPLKKPLITFSLSVDSPEKEISSRFVFVLLAGQGYIKAKNYPSSTSVEVMAEGGESAMFKQLFQSWRDKGQTQGLGTTHAVGRIGTTAYMKTKRFDEINCRRSPHLGSPRSQGGQQRQVRRDAAPRTP